MFGGGATPKPDFTMQGVEMGEDDPLLETAEEGRMTVFDWGTDGQDQGKCYPLVNRGTWGS